MKIVTAIDSFKGSMTSMEAGLAVTEGVHRVDSDVDVQIRPLADGGEGTVEALVAGMNGMKQEIQVTGPLGTPVACEYGIIESSKTAVIEMAGAAGITLVLEQGGVDCRRCERECLPLPYSRGDSGRVRYRARRASYLANRARCGAYCDRPRLVGALGGLLLAIRRGATSGATRHSIRSDRFQGRASRDPRTICALLPPRPWSRSGFSSRMTSSALLHHDRLLAFARAAPRLRTGRPIPQGHFRAAI